MDECTTALFKRRRFHPGGATIRFGFCTDYKSIHYSVVPQFVLISDRSAPDSDSPVQAGAAILCICICICFVQTLESVMRYSSSWSDLGPLSSKSKHLRVSFLVFCICLLGTVSGDDVTIEHQQVEDNSSMMMANYEAGRQLLAVTAAGEPGDSLR